MNLNYQRKVRTAAFFLTLLLLFLIKVDYNMTLLYHSCIRHFIARVIICHTHNLFYFLIPPRFFKYIWVLTAHLEINALRFVLDPMYLRLRVEIANADPNFLTKIIFKRLK